MFPIHGLLVGLGATRVTLSTQTVAATDLAGNGHMALGGFKLGSDGQASKATGSTAAPLSYSNISGEWLSHIASGLGANYDVNFTVDTESGAAGTWAGDTRGSYINLGTTRTWTWQKDTDAVGTATANITVYISKAGLGTPIASVSLTMTSEETS